MASAEFKKDFNSLSFTDKKAIVSKINPEFAFDLNKLSVVDQAEVLNASDNIDWGRVGAETIGGVIGGGLGVSSPVPGGAYYGMGLGAEAGGQIYDVTKGLLSGQPPQGTVPQRVMKAGENVMLQSAVPKAIDVAAPVVKQGVANMFGPLRNKFSNIGSGELLDAYTRQGVTPQAGAVSGNVGVQTIEQGLTNLPGPAGVIQKAGRQTLDETGAASARIARQAGTPGDVGALGQEFQSASNRALDQFKNYSNKIFEPIDEAIGLQSKVQIPNTVRILSEILGETGAAPGSQKALVSGVKRLEQTLVDDLAVNDGALPYTILKRWRNQIGEKIGFKQTSALKNMNISDADWSRIYGGMAEDTRLAAGKAGVGKQYDEAASYYSKMMNEELPFIRKVAERETGAKAYDLVMEGSKQSSERLRHMRRYMTKEEWDNVAASFIDNLGKAKPGAQSVEGDVFSPSVFLTNWNSLKPARHEILRGTRFAGITKDLDDLAQIAASQKAVQAIVNSSNTGRANAIIAMFLNPFRTALATGPAYATAKMMTKPWFVKWLAHGARVSKSKPGSLGGHMARLWTAAERNKSEADIIELLSATQVSEDKAVSTLK